MDNNIEGLVILNWVLFHTTTVYKLSIIGKNKAFEAFLYKKNEEKPIKVTPHYIFLLRFTIIVKLTI